LKGLKMAEEQIEVLQYAPQGVCCQLMNVKIQGDKILDSEFFGGCNGNLKGIRSLIKGMSVDDVISRLEGIQCGSKFTSCPDQLAKCLIEYKQQKLAKL
jgi:uncharacterized protein (TIGR03905 family)